MEGATCSSCAPDGSRESVKFGKKRVFLVGTIIFMTLTAEVATSKLAMGLSFLYTVDMSPPPLGSSFPGQFLCPGSCK